MATESSPTSLAQLKEKLNALIAKVASGEGEFKWPKGEIEGIAALEFQPGQWDFIFTYTPEGESSDRSVEIHLFPSKNPRELYDQLKEAALNPNPWGETVGWVDSPKGFPNRNDYDDIRMSGSEEKNPRYVRWVQQTQGAEGGYFVRLETTSEAPTDYLKEYADGLWYIVNQLGYYLPPSQYDEPPTEN